MSINYNLFSGILNFRKKKWQEDGSCKNPGKSSFNALLTLLVILTGIMGVQGQTTLLSPTGDGGFENAGSNNWLFANSPTNYWTIGTAAGASNGTKAAYITNNGSSYAYTANTGALVYSWMYRNITVNAGETNVTVSFKTKLPNTDSANDKILVYAAPITTTPVANADLLAGTFTSVATVTANQAAYTASATLTLPATYTATGVNGTTQFRLIIGWANNTLTAGTSPGAIDEINVVGNTPVTYTTNVVGTAGTPALWSATSTWSGGVVPPALSTSAYSNIVIASGAVVNIGTALASQKTNDLTVNGTLYGSQALTVAGNLTVASGGVLRMNDGAATPVGKVLTVGGNFTNNGTVDLSAASSSLVFNGHQKQTNTGSGTFTNGLVRALRFQNNWTTTGINATWGYNNVITDALTLGVSATVPSRVDLGANTIFLGYSGNAGSIAGPIAFSLSIQGDSGFTSGTISKYYASGSAGGSLWGANTDPSIAGSRFPFVSAANAANRSAYISRDTNANSAAFDISATYSDASAISPVTVVDGAYTINNRYDGNWTFATTNGSASNIYHVGVWAPNGLYVNGNATPGNARVLHATTPMATGAHQTGTNTPTATRLNVTQADLTNGAIYIGNSAADGVTLYSAQSGNWEDEITWVDPVTLANRVPQCGDAVVITAGTDVEVTGLDNLSQPAASVAKSLLISTGGSLTLQTAGTTTTIGCTGNNNAFVNNGKLEVKDGTLIINGYLSSVAVSGGILNPNIIFTQSGGTIKVNGNSGTASTSVPAGTSICRIYHAPTTMSFTGGTLNIVNPHMGTSATQDYALYIQSSASLSPNYAASTNHTVVIGDDTSTIAGGSNLGFLMRGDNFSYGTVMVKSANGGTNRNASGGLNGSLYINDLTINSGGEYKNFNTLGIIRNLVNNGTLTSLVSPAISTSSTLSFSQNNLSTGGSPFAQSVSGTGLFRNNEVTANSTGSIGNLTITNATGTAAGQGVTMNVPLSMTGNLSLTNGVLHTTDTNLLTMGNAALGLGGNTTFAPWSPWTANGAATSTVLAYVDGPLARVIPSGSDNLTFYRFPVGKGSYYAPIEIAPTTTANTVIKASYDTSNTGTFDATVTALNGTNRWDVPVISGAITNAHVRVGAALAGSGTLTQQVTNAVVPLSATTATGVYTTTFGSTNGVTNTALFTAASGSTPAFMRSDVAGTYKDAIGFGSAAACTGTPAPGATIASTNNICLGTTVTFTLENVIAGGGVTYQWKTSVDGSTNWTNIAGATTATYTGAPTAALYYRCDVTCSGNTGTSTPVKIDFTSAVTNVASTSRCGYGTVTLSATESDTRWYSASSIQPLNADYIGTGTSVPTTTPINTTTTYYAARETYTTGSTGTILSNVLQNGTQSTTIMQFSSIYAATINSIDFYPKSTTATTYYINLNSTMNGFEIGAPVASVAVTISPEQIGTKVTVPLNFSIPANADNWTLGIYNKGGSTPYNSTDGINCGTGSVSGFPFYYGGFAVTRFINGVTTTAIFNWNVTTTTICSSPRTPAVATVTAPTGITFSAAPAAICNGNTSAAYTVTANTGGYTNFEWTPSTGVMGDSTTGWTFNPTATTAYALKVSTASGNEGCVLLVGDNTTTATTIEPTFTMTVNPLHPTFKVKRGDGIHANTLCGGATVQKMEVSYPTSIGSYTTTPPFSSGFQSINPVNYVSSATVFDPLYNNTIRVSPATTGTAGAKFTVTSASPVYVMIYSSSVTTGPPPSPVLLAAGMTPLTATIPQSGVSRVWLYAYADNAGTALTSVVNCTVLQEPLSIPTWTPITGLYTDAAATVAYTGTAAAAVYVKGTEALTSYTATCTTAAPANCPTAIQFATQAPIVDPVNDAVICAAAGAVTTLTTEVDASPNATFQWETRPKGSTTSAWTPVTNGTTYSGATTKTLTVTRDANKLPVAGTQYRLKATECGFDVYTNQAVLVDSKAPLAKKLTASSLSLCTGNTGVTLTIATSSIGNVEIQKSTTSSTGPWTTEATYPQASLNAVNGVITRATGALAATTWYKAVFTNGSCSAVTSLETPMVTVSQPSNGGAIATTDPDTVCAYSTLTTQPMTNSTVLNVTGTVGTLQWYSTTTDPAGPTTPTWKKLTGATLASYTALNLKVNTWFKVTAISGACSSADSAPFKITVTPTAKAGKLTAPVKTICQNVGTVTITHDTANASIGDPIAWEESLDKITWTTIDGATGDVLNYTNTDHNTPGLSFYIRAKVGNGGCSNVAYSAPYTLKVDATSVGGTATGGTMVCSNNTGGGTVKLSGNTGKTIMWQYSINGTDYQDVEIGGVAPYFGSTSTSRTGTSYIVSGITQDVWFRATVANGTCSSTVSSATMFDYTTPATGTLSTTDTLPLCANPANGGITITRTGTYTGTSFKWEKSTDNGTTWGTATQTVPDANTLVTGPLTKTTLFRFRAYIKAGNCSVASDSFEAVVTPKAVAKSIAAVITSNCADTGTVTLTVGSGSVGTINWEVSATSDFADYTVLGSHQGQGSINAAASGNYENPNGINYYRVRFSNGCADVLSAAKTVTLSNTGSCTSSLKGADTITPVRNEFNAVAYPNPYASNFSLRLTTTSDARVGLTVYDMTGRLIDQREVSVTEVSSLQIGDRYPTGVYNLIVTQGNDVKTLRVVKQ